MKKTTINVNAYYINHLKIFRFHWMNGKIEEKESVDVADAFSKLGYKSKDVNGLSFYESAPTASMTERFILTMKIPIEVATDENWRENFNRVCLWHFKRHCSVKYNKGRVNENNLRFVRV